MTRVFLLFPGQGAQVVGMARDAYESGGHARALFEEANEILDFDFSGLVFEGDPEVLARTENCQPAILVASLALLSSLRENRRVEIVGAAGLSLGEYTALTALEALDFADAVRLVRERGKLMEAAAQGKEAGMASLIGLEAAAVEELCREASAEGIVTPANYNCPGQIAISGEKAALAKACELAKARGARRALPLNVSGAFHSPLMEPARQGLAKLLAETSVRRPEGRFVNNADAQELNNPELIRESLARQLVSPVRWDQSCRLILGWGEKNFVEVGPGNVLRGLMKRIDETATVISFDSLAALESVPED